MDQGPRHRPAVRPVVSRIQGRTHQRSPYNVSPEKSSPRSRGETRRGGQVTTPLDALIAAVEESGGYNSAAETAPEAIVWCDANREFVPLLVLLRTRLPQLVTYGDYDPAMRTGPAV